VAGKPIIDNEYAVLTYYADSKIVHHRFKRPISGQNLYEVVDMGVELLKKHGAQKWLSDDRANGPMPQKDLDWANDNWFPRAIAAGWKFWALVVPEDVMGRMNMKDYVMSFHEKGIRVMVFTNPDEAMEWLESR
jgi:hypothetical protein